MDDEEHDLDDVWDKLADAEAPADEPEDESEQEIDFGTPVRVTMVIRAGGIPVVPWAQGWRVGALGPDEDGHVTLICEHDIDLSPVAQLSAVTGLLGSIKQAQLDLVWWAIQTRGPLPGEHADVVEDIDQEFHDLLEQRDDAQGADGDTDDGVDADLRELDE